MVTDTNIAQAEDQAYREKALREHSDMRHWQNRALTGAALLGTQATSRQAVAPSQCEQCVPAQTTTNLSGLSWTTELAHEKECPNHPEGK